MKFFWKMFFALFLSISTMGGFLLWTTYTYMHYWIQKEYIVRYSNFAKVLGDTLGSLDSNTESLMKNAAEIVAREEKEKGLLSREDLIKLRDRISVTHLFMIDKKGDFIRSTNEDPRLIPNAFSFCPAYRNLFQSDKFEATPLIHPQPEIKPFKFLFYPTLNQEHLIEVGVRVDFVAQTLTKALGSDPNLIGISLYSPAGEVLGRFTSKGTEFKEGRAALPQQFPQLLEEKDFFRHFSKLVSSHPKCCQCEVSGVSRNGEYYYILETEISKGSLKSVHTAIKAGFIFLTFIAGLLGFFISRGLSRRLVFKIEEAAERVNAIKKGGPQKRINMPGSDEISYFTQELDRLLDEQERTQEKLVETEKLKTKVQLAREVAHNMRSPLLAIEALIEDLSENTLGIKEILAGFCLDIRKLSERLLKQAGIENEFPDALTPIDIGACIENLLVSKSFVAKSGRPHQFKKDFTKEFSEARVKVDPTELKSVITNLINNAIEANEDIESTKATEKNLPVVQIRGEILNHFCHLTIRDFGKGIPSEVLAKVGVEEVTHGKSQGQGIGLLHAHKTIKAWGGKIEIESQVGTGTQVKVILPLAP